MSQPENDEEIKNKEKTENEKKKRAEEAKKKLIKVGDMEVEENAEFNTPESKIATLLRKREIKNIETKKKNEKDEKFKKPTKTKTITLGQEKLNDIIKNKILNSENILTNYKTLGLIETESDAVFFEKLAKSVISNYKININDILSYQNFKILISNFSQFDFGSRVFSNDKLFWLSKIKNLLVGDDEYKEMDNYVSFENMDIYICSRLEEIKDDYKQYYIRDYSGDFSLTGYELLSLEEKNKIKQGKIDMFKKKDNEGFIFENINYSVYETDSTEVRIVIKTSEESKLVEFLKNIETFDTKNKMNKDQVNIHKIKTSDGITNIYLSQNIKYVDFCPSELCFAEKIKNDFYIKANILPLEFESYLIKTTETSNPQKISDYIKVRGLVNWETVDLFVNFLVVEAATVFKKENYIKNYEKLSAVIKDFLKDYREVKSYFAYVKNDIIKTLNFFTKFFQSFQTRISFETMNKLSKNFTNIYESINRIIEKKFCITIETFIEKYDLENIFVSISNCIKDNMKVIKKILDLLNIFFEKFEDRNGDKIIENLREIGTLIFGIMRFSKQDKSFIIDSFITPAVFLGGLLENEDFLAKKLETKIETVEKKEIKEQQGEIDIIAKSEEFRTLNTLNEYLARLIEIYTGNTQFFEKGKLAGPASNWFKSLFSEDLKSKNEEIISDKDVKILLNTAISSKAANKPFRYDLPAVEKINEMLMADFENTIEKDKSLSDYAKAILSEKIRKLNEAMNNLDGRDMIYPIFDTVTVNDLIRLEIPVINPSDVTSKLYKQIEEYRKKGITDDVIRDMLTYDYDVADIKDITENDLTKLPTEEEITEAKIRTQDLWGSSGSEFMKLINRKNKEISKLKIDNKLEQKPKRKVMKFKYSLGKREAEGEDRLFTGKKRKKVKKEEPKKEEPKKEGSK